MHKNLLLFLISTFLCVLLASFLFKSFFKNTRLTANKYSVAATGNQYAFYCFDELLGWANTPFSKGTYKREEFEYKIAINEFGMRQGSVQLEPSKDVFRVAVLGDSFVWGIGVSDNDRFTDIIAKSPEIEVLNFGVSGYGPIQYYLMLDKVIKFKPDLVIIAFCLGNDFGDNVLYKRYGYYKPYAQIDEKGNCVVKGFPLKNVKKFGGKATKHPHILKRALAIFESKYNRIFHKGLVDFNDRLIYRNDKLNKKEKDLVLQVALINKKLLQEIKKKFDSVNISLAIATVPTKSEYKDNFINFNSVNLLNQAASELNIDFIKTVSMLDINDFWKHDGHWNKTGHQKMAKPIKEYILKIKSKKLKQKLL